MRVAAFAKWPSGSLCKLFSIANPKHMQVLSLPLSALVSGLRGWALLTDTCRLFLAAYWTDSVKERRGLSEWSQNGTRETQDIFFLLYIDFGATVFASSSTTTVPTEWLLGTRSLWDPVTLFPSLSAPDFGVIKTFRGVIKAFLCC